MMNGNGIEEREALEGAWLRARFAKLDLDEWLVDATSDKKTLRAQRAQAIHAEVLTDVSLAAGWTARLIERFGEVDADSGEGKVLAAAIEGGLEALDRLNAEPPLPQSGSLGEVAY